MKKVVIMDQKVRTSRKSRMTSTTLYTRCEKGTTNWGPNWEGGPDLLEKLSG